MSKNFKLELTEQEARHLMNCIMRTNAKGKDLDVGEMIEKSIIKYLNGINMCEYSDVCEYMDKILWSTKEDGHSRFPRVPGGFPSEEILIKETRAHFEGKNIIDLEGWLSDAYHEIKREYLEFFER